LHFCFHILRIALLLHFSPQNVQMTTELKMLRSNGSLNELSAIAGGKNDVLENAIPGEESEPKRSRIQIIALLIALNVRILFGTDI
jgi:hypothetical protein